MATKVILGVFIAFVLSGCFATRPCETRFAKAAMQHEELLRATCDYILQNNINGGFANHSAFGIASIKDDNLRMKLDNLSIGTIYIHDTKIYHYSYPQDSSIAFMKRSLPWVGNREYIIFSFSKGVDTLNLQDFYKSKDGVIFCKKKKDIFYYSH